MISFSSVVEVAYDEYPIVGVDASFVFNFEWGFDSLLRNFLSTLFLILGCLVHCFTFSPYNNRSVLGSFKSKLVS